MNLYHTDLGLPKGFALPDTRVPLMWTEHAKKARTSDRYGVIPMVETLPLASFSVIEVAMTGKRVEKVVVRGSFTKDLDAVFVLIPGEVWKVKTVWINKKNDTHKTLDRSKYVVIG